MVSRRIRSVCCSVAYSHEYAVISSPCLVLIVALVILSLLFGCSGVGSGRAGACCCVSVRCCFVELPSAMSSVTCLFGGDGDGIAGLLWQLVGAVAIGELANAGIVVAICVSVIALGGSYGRPFCSVVGVARSAGVCVSVVAVDCLLGGWKPSLVVVVLVMLVVVSLLVQ